MGGFIEREQIVDINGCSPAFWGRTKIRIIAERNYKKKLKSSPQRLDCKYTTVDTECR